MKLNTPWRYKRGISIVEYYILYDANAKRIGEANTEEQAQAIVTAVNGLEVAVEALEFYANQPTMNILSDAGTRARTTLAKIRENG